jgi:hypothetical protein
MPKFVAELVDFSMATNMLHLGGRVSVRPTWQAYIFDG